MNYQISIILPVYNEEGNLGILTEEIKEVFLENTIQGEIIFIDDGSADSSNNKIKEIAKENTDIKLITFSKNFGQTAAFSAGIKEASGKFIITMDADGQNNPKDIPALIKELNKGFDVVSGWRKNRKDNYISRVLPSLAANFIISRITGIALHDYGCSLKIYKSEFLKKADLYGEMHRFLPAIMGYMGAKISEIEVNHRPRKSGKSKYGLTRIFKVILDLFTVKFMGDYLSKPIYFFGGIGFFLLFLSSCSATFTLYKKFYCDIFVKDQPLFLVAILLAIIGIQFVVLGLLAEINVRTYYKTNKKPPYFIKEKEGD
ncbi:MAG: glycosyltransferase family 2 protein [Elusimicrobiales bacterium]|nr:glycosyltransferase family 2 protein [Elusimicrobiales bacterium]